MAYPETTDPRYAFKIDNTNVDESLTDCPVLLQLDNLPTAVREWLNTTTKANGLDIRITSSDGTTTLKYELQNYTKSGGVVTGEIYFKAPSISDSAATQFYLYADGSAADGDDAAGVWSDYEAVYHLNESPDDTEPSMKDSAGNYDGTCGSALTATESVAGNFGKCIDFKGSNTSYVDLNDGGGLTSSASEDYTLQCWWKKGSTGVQVAVGSFTGAWLGVHSANKTNFSAGGGSAKESASSTSNNAWHAIVGTRDATTDQTRLWVNGALKATAGGSTSTVGTASNDWHIGQYGTNRSYDWSNPINEVRFRKSKISDAQIKFEYYNVDESDNELQDWTQENAGGGGSSVTPRLIREPIRSLLRQVV